MCGIIGILGTHETAPSLVEALRRLEYRGYDSAGIATVDNGRLDRRRAAGKLDNLSDLLVHQPLTGKSGIGHTRWATHGGPSTDNAHPHISGRVGVVHNGIIENFKPLREDLAKSGYAAETETDTETIALLTARHLDEGLDEIEAVRATLAQLEGAFALAFLFAGQDDLMIGARRGSPLAVGWGTSEMYLGSDAIALAPLTDRITYLDEGDMVVLSRTTADIYDSSGQRANRPMRRIEVDNTRVEKGGYKHFMEKEIAEQPRVMAELLGAYIDDTNFSFPEEVPDFKEIDRVIIVACGTAFYAGLTAKYWFEQIARIPVEIDVASEFRYREPPIGERALAIFVSQSGETADTLAALRYCADKSRTLAVVNVTESSIARESDVVLPIYAGVEIGVASTKAFTCQLGVLAMLALKAGHDRGQMSQADLATAIGGFNSLPGLMSQVLNREEAIDKVCHELSDARDILFLGRGQMFPLAMEGALKLKEISYIHAEGYASGELKHGPIALIDPAVPVIVFAPSDELFDKTVSNMQEVMARGGKVLLVSDRHGVEMASEGVWRIIEMPDIAALLAPLLYALPAQLLAYHTAVAKGTDVDQPRNLAKSVTVE